MQNDIVNINDLEPKQYKKFEKKQFVVPTPIEIKDYLDTVVVGQHEAKKRVSIEVYKHLLRLQNMFKLEEEGKELNKSNVLMTGLTGTGKTLMWKAIAHFIDLPIFIQDCTNLTEAGYVGEDTENCLKGLLASSGYSVPRAEMGIIVLDEFDKLGRKGENTSITRDVSGEGVQQALLKILEGDVVTIPEGKRRHPSEQGTQIDTSKILFVAIGSFEGIEDIVKQRMNKKENKSSMGFGAVIKSKSEEESLKDLRTNITRDDLVKFGIMPEILGRFPVLTNFEPLTKEDLIDILKLENGIFEEYKTIFQLMDKSLEIKEDIYDFIADKAISENVGGRGLRAIAEDIMYELMFIAPSDNRRKNYVIDMNHLKKYEIA